MDIDKDEMRERLRRAGAELVRPEYLQKRIPFDLPVEKRSKDSWLRVRDEGDEIGGLEKLVFDMENLFVKAG